MIILQNSSENRVQTQYHSSFVLTQFLAMKLSTVNPRLGVNVESLVSKDVCDDLQLFRPFPLFRPCSIKQFSFFIFLQRWMNPVKFPYSKQDLDSQEICVTMLMLLMTGSSLSLVSFNSSHGTIVRSGVDAQTIATRNAPGRCSWHGQFRYVQNNNAVILPRAVIPGLQLSMLMLYPHISLIFTITDTRKLLCLI